MKYSKPEQTTSFFNGFLRGVLGVLEYFNGLLVAVIGEGISSAVQRVHWPHRWQEEFDAKKKFDVLVTVLEDKHINGVEFECSGCLCGSELWMTVAPSLTERGEKLIMANDRSLSSSTVV